jgi:hypothetical protein
MDHKAYESKGSFTCSVRVRRILHLFCMSDKDLTPTRVREILHQSSVGVRSLPLLKSECNIPPLFQMGIHVYNLPFKYC